MVGTAFDPAGGVENEPVGPGDTGSEGDGEGDGEGVQVGCCGGITGGGRTGTGVGVGVGVKGLLDWALTTVTLKRSPKTRRPSALSIFTVASFREAWTNSM